MLCCGSKTGYGIKTKRDSKLSLGKREKEWADPPELREGRVPVLSELPRVGGGNCRDALR